MNASPQHAAASQGLIRIEEGSREAGPAGNHRDWALRMQAARTHDGKAAIHPYGWRCFPAERPRVLGRENTGDERLGKRTLCGICNA